MLGGDLKLHLSNDARFDEQRARFHIAEVLLGLEHLHGKNVIFRDLKLENVLLDEKGHCKISDLGLSVQLKNKTDQISGYAGTPGYTAPEVVLGLDYSFTVDFFSLGVMIYRCLSGKKPFDSKQAKDDTSQLDRNVIELEPDYSKYFFQSQAKSLLKGVLLHAFFFLYAVTFLMDLKAEICTANSCCAKIQKNGWEFMALKKLKTIHELFFLEQLDEIHSSCGDNEPPKKDGEYEEVKLKAEFEESVKDFSFISKKAIQEELVDILSEKDRARHLKGEPITAYETEEEESEEQCSESKSGLFDGLITSKINEKLYFSVLVKTKKFKRNH
ncbi:G-protein-coupled Receptor Kinase family member (grk-1) [Reticulomyxa filosa]|uniref:G-protein-coupled Receptor Kinase family member (Grk-1) n=1 Tax=Reticulomyxa filosa TaxID=46433 RepID=X6LUZ9_RETFI|nr:G-protein-coupled Receptor Kinase family member (grk-1) [Reticulomyxa filosa]|eukprot:ETO05424.1 G-protein-coupled Receptor Kinase family member (grk-1) [Reticulomyxa filosa]